MALSSHSAVITPCQIAVAVAAAATVACKLVDSVKQRRRIPVRSTN
jgi:hypothetical protein